MVLIHGWDPDYYNSKMSDKPVQEDIVWKHRSQLILSLGSSFNISYFNLPGFCGVPEPKKDYFDVEDFTNNFADWVKRQEKPPELILGYSFGGVIALDYKVRHAPDIPVVLISPALVRGTSLKSQLAQHGKNLIPKVVFQQLKSYYQRLFSRYYREGDEFLQKSYDHIARRNFANSLTQVDRTSILLIYGDQDTSTPWSLVKDRVTDANLDHYLITNGGHAIGQTHPKEIVAAINAFLARHYTDPRLSWKYLSQEVTDKAFK